MGKDRPYRRSQSCSCIIMGTAEKSENFAVMEFVNPVIIDIFSHYCGNSALADIVSPDGNIKMRFHVSPDIITPTSAEQVLSLMYALLESNPDSPAGKVYVSHMTDILRETVYRLGQVIDAFRNVKMSVDTFDAQTNTRKHTEFSLSKTSSASTTN